MATIRAHLRTIGISALDLAGLPDTQSECVPLGAAFFFVLPTLPTSLNPPPLPCRFSKIKKAYFVRVLSAHPDKGGDPAVFRACQEAWEAIRALYDAGKVHANGFQHYFGAAGAAHQAAPAAADFDFSHAASYAWFEAAAQEPVCVSLPDYYFPLC